MSDLTGWPTYYNRFPNERRDFEQIESYANDLWKKLQKADTKGYFMCASTPGVDDFTETSGPDEEFGIVPGHAYSVISCKEYDGIRLLKIRNPWGSFEWGGAWSDNSSEWTQEYIDYFQPDFDTQDGTFWMWIEDFFKCFESITVCKMADWKEVRLKGKFIRLKESENEDEDWVLSKFYYSFHLEETAKIDICLHQEDERVLGTDRRRYIDMQILILKRNDDGTLSLAYESQIKRSRDNEICVGLEPGHYIVVPRTIGALMSAPSDPQPPIDPYFTFNDRKIMHPNYFSTINDVFRKLDLEMNGVVTSSEMNQFGHLIDDEKWINFTEEELGSGSFEGISCSSEGITKYGFMQLMMREDPETLNENLRKLGYDESLYSLKSRVFTISFHTEYDLRVRVGDACKTELNERAWDLMMENHYKENGATKAFTTDRLIIFRKKSDDPITFTCGAINKTDNEVELKLDQTKSSGMLFIPSNGTSKIVIPPKSVVYLASWIFDPVAEEYSFNYSVNEREWD